MTERERGKKGSSIRYFTDQMIKGLRLGQAETKELEVSSRSHTWVAGTQALGSYSTAFLGTLAGSESEQLKPTLRYGILMLQEGV